LGFAVLFTTLTPYQGAEKGLEFPQQGEKPYRRHPGESRGPVFYFKNQIVQKSSGFRLSLE
jgi:hypothetical protein